MAQVVTGKPKIPDPVPLDKTDPERQKMYGVLKANASQMPKEVPSQILPEASEEKKEFIRCILGRVPYSKTYTLFGRIKVIFFTRTVEQSERLNELVYVMSDKEDRDLWRDRFNVITTLKTVRDPEQGEYWEVPETMLVGDWKDAAIRYLMKLPQPLYIALMEQSRVFEKHVEDLTDAAGQPGFWPTAGLN